MPLVNSECSLLKIHDQYAYDSRGNPTVEVKLITNKGLFRSIVPSGASTGSHEAIELRDGDKSKWLGKGVTKAVHNVNTVIAPAIIKEDMDIKNQQPVDDFLNSLYGTDNKSNLGTNTILGVSLSIARAAASEKGIPFYRHLAELSGTNKDKFVMPVPFLNVLNDGDEGGIAPKVETPREALNLIVAAIDKAGYSGKVHIALDPASSEFFKDGKYDLDFKNPNSDKSKWLSGEQLASLYSQLSDEYAIISLEDLFAEDDWDSWVHFFPKIAGRIPIVADDFTVRNTRRIKEAIEKKAANSLLLKVN